MITRDEIQQAIAVELAIHGLEEARRILKLHVMPDETTAGICGTIGSLLHLLKTHECALGSIYSASSEGEHRLRRDGASSTGL
jgi:hypothetical protein